MAVVTGLRELADGGVEVELEGRPWRTLPAGVVVGAGVLAGRDLDRQALRRLRRELRRAEAIDLAARALARRDLSRSELRERLERKGVSGSTAEEAIEGLARAGSLDEARLAERRAEVLAGRSHGDAAIRYDLERRGLPADAIDEALARLPSEVERARAAVAVRGATLTTARFLAGKGFSEEAIRAAVPGLDAPGSRALR